MKISPAQIVISKARSACEFFAPAFQDFSLRSK